jgi:hypothetical protein
MTPPAPITYRFERADCWRLGRVVYRPGVRGRLRSLAFMTICLAAGLAIGVGHWPTRAEWSALLREPWLLGLFAAFLVLSQFAHFLNVAILWARFGSLAVANRRVTLTFAEDALSGDVEGTHSTVPWTNFIARIETPDAVFLKIGRWEALTVPRRAFPDNASWHAARAFLQEKVPHGQA